MTDVTWDFVTDTNGTITATGVMGNTLPTFKRGGTVTLTLLFDGQVSNHVSQYKQMREYVEFASSETIGTGKSMYGVPYFREQLHPNAGFDSFLMKVSPSANVAGVEDYWCVVVGGSDNTQFVGAGERLTVELFVLGDTTEYSTRADVESELEADR